MTRQQMIEKRRKRDKQIKFGIYAVASLTILTLTAIILYVFFTGIHLVKWDTIIGDSADINTDVYVTDEPGSYTNDYNGDDELYFSTKWGIGFIDTYDKEGHEIVEIGYVSENSPFTTAIDKNNKTEDDLDITLPVEVGYTFEKAFIEDETGSLTIVLGTNTAEFVANAFDNGYEITSMSIQNSGGGIRGSIITTLILIVMTLILAVPIGISTAIYFNEYAKKSRISEIIRYLVDLLTGVPSIIYGLLGAAVFIPLVNKLTAGSELFKTAGGSLFSGALTLAVIILPVIIKSTEEALKVIPDDLRNASLALGASKTQTTFKVVLPSAIPGVLTGVMLSIGRVIGESAALIFAVGAAIKDVVRLNQKSTTLAVHIWTAMSGEEPNFELAAAIAIIILIVVFVLNIIVKIVANRMNKAWY